MRRWEDGERRGDGDSNRTGKGWRRMEREEAGVKAGGGWRGKRHPVPGQLLEGPELVDTVEDGLGTVHQPAAHLLQVPQDSDVTVRLHPRRGHAHHRHLGDRKSTRLNSSH